VPELSTAWSRGTPGQRAGRAPRDLRSLLSQSKMFAQPREIFAQPVLNQVIVCRMFAASPPPLPCQPHSMHRLLLFLASRTACIAESSLLSSTSPRASLRHVSRGVILSLEIFDWRSPPAPPPPPVTPPPQDQHRLKSHLSPCMAPLVPKGM